MTPLTPKLFVRSFIDRLLAADSPHELAGMIKKMPHDLKDSKDAAPRIAQATPLSSSEALQAGLTTLGVKSPAPKEEEMDQLTISMLAQKYLGAEVAKDHVVSFRVGETVVNLVDHTDFKNFGFVHLEEHLKRSATAGHMEILCENPSFPLQLGNHSIEHDMLAIVATALYGFGFSSIKNVDLTKSFQFNLLNKVIHLDAMKEILKQLKIKNRAPGNTLTGGFVNLLNLDLTKYKSHILSFHNDESAIEYEKLLKNISDIDNFLQFSLFCREIARCSLNWISKNCPEVAFTPSEMDVIDSCLDKGFENPKPCLNIINRKRDWVYACNAFWLLFKGPDSLAKKGKPIAIVLGSVHHKNVINFMQQLYSGKMEAPSAPIQWTPTITDTKKDFEKAESEDNEPATGAQVKTQIKKGVKSQSWRLVKKHLGDDAKICFQQGKINGLIVNFICLNDPKIAASKALMEGLDHESIKGNVEICVQNPTFPFKKAHSLEFGMLTIMSNTFKAMQVFYTQAFNHLKGSPSDVFKSHLLEFLRNSMPLPHMELVLNELHKKKDVYTETTKRLVKLANKGTTLEDIHRELLKNEYSEKGVRIFDFYLVSQDILICALELLINHCPDLGFGQEDLRLFNMSPNHLFNELNDVDCINRIMVKMEWIAASYLYQDLFVEASHFIPFVKSGKEVVVILDNSLNPEKNFKSNVSNNLRMMLKMKDGDIPCFGRGVEFKFNVSAKSLKKGR